MVAASPQVIKRGAAGAAGCVEGLWSASLKGQGKRFLRWTGLMAGGFLGLTAFQAEGCGGGFGTMSFIVSHLSSIPEHAPPLDITMSADTPIVISTEAKRSGEISLHHGS